MLIKADEKFDDGDLADVAIKQGILIRKCSNFKGLSPSFFRIAVRTEGENKTLLDVFRQIVCATRINR